MRGFFTTKGTKIWWFPFQGPDKMRIMVPGDRNEFFWVFLTEARRARRWGTRNAGGDLFLLELLDLFFAQAGGLDDDVKGDSGGF